MRLSAFSHGLNSFERAWTALPTALPVRWVTPLSSMDGFLLNAPGATPDVVATQVFNNVAVNLAASLIISYGLAEVRFDTPTPFLMTITVAFSALLNGIVIPLRSGLTNAAFVLNSGID